MIEPLESDDLNICLNGHSITGNNNGPAITVGDGGGTDNLRIYKEDCEDGDGKEQYDR